MTNGGFYFNPFGKGLEIFLGPTEAILMEIAWDQKSLTVKKALYYMDNKKDLAYTTVMTIMSRLADKGLLKKEKNGKSFVYYPVCTKKEFIESRKNTVLKSLKQL